MKDKYMDEGIKTVEKALGKDVVKFANTFQTVVGINALELGAIENMVGFVNNHFEEYVNETEPDLLLKYGQMTFARKMIYAKESIGNRTKEMRDYVEGMDDETTNYQTN